MFLCLMFQVQKAEPISAHPDKLREQIEENRLMLEDLEKRKDAVEHVKAAAEELIAKGEGVFLVIAKNAFIPAKHVHSVNTYSKI